MGHRGEHEVPHRGITAILNGKMEKTLCLPILKKRLRCPAHYRRNPVMSKGLGALPQRALGGVCQDRRIARTVYDDHFQRRNFPKFRIADTTCHFMVEIFFEQ